MGKSEKQKELIAQYKQRPVTGGVYKIENMENGRYYLDVTQNLAGMKNRFDFFTGTGSGFNPKLNGDTKKYGAGAFRFVVLEELEKKETQSAEDYRADLETLRALWSEKLDGSLSY